MKNLLITLTLLLFSATGFSQNTAKTPEPRVFTKAKLGEIKSINELVTDDLKNKNFVSIDMVVKSGGKPLNANAEVSELTEEMKNLLKKADVGTKVYFDIKWLDTQTTPNVNRIAAFAIKVG